MRRFPPMTMVAIVTVLAPLALEAQTTISSRGASLTIGGRLHFQYQGSSVDGAVSDFFVRRARINTDASFNDFLDGRVQVDFAGGTATLLDAYLQMTFDDGLRLSIGQLKRSFDPFELASSTDLSIIERAGGIRGYSTCTGVGSVCSYGRLSEALELSNRDVGVRVDGSSGTVTYQATVTNGTGVGRTDENDGKSFAGRVGFAMSDKLTLSGNVNLHDYVDPAAETAYAVAWGGDVEYGTWRDGLHVQAGLIGGDNWMEPDLGADPVQFLAFQGVATYYRPLDGDRIVAIEPLVRVSVGDPDGSTADDGGILLTPGVMLYFMGKNRIGANLDYYIPGAGDSEFSLRLGTFLYF